MEIWFLSVLGLSFKSVTDRHQLSLQSLDLTDVLHSEKQLREVRSARLPGKRYRVSLWLPCQEWEGISSNVSRSTKGFNSIRKAIL